ncbi:replication initiation and membrane attachment family protein [Mesobacillus maritimus]|uniref:replication initiation and membrane attachment family protein n=1 Tax=Mesobacillus maritimus TaxID=1643336 RepID=UPI00203E0975|nr:replication initiation and membrane attachment family protein [Mesobacillus maritimus]MCM3588629.1 replication initiation and membrane attachment family protein [Mesobacillus maritimus]MCM3670012.1 replication initiation and membrane attachment family protein [Mesobacillus maritimus]
MTQHWQEILPVDQYSVASSGLLHEYDRKVLTFLYQPLIGPVCLSLYMTLWAELEENRLWSESTSHHSLMSLLDLNLKEIYQARLKLEGMGLLKTYMKNDDDNRFFIYELQPPLTPEQFFLDGMLNIFLYRKVGKNQFFRLKRFFADKSVRKQEQYSEVTRAFQDVFVSASPDALRYHRDSEEELAPPEGQEFIGRQSAEAIQIDTTTFDFELLTAGLTESLVPKKALTARVKEAISNLAFLYGIDPLQMKNLLLSALTAENEIDIDELRKAARDWFQFEHQDQLPQLLDRTQPFQLQSAKTEPVTQEDKLMQYFDKASPRELLVQLSQGATPSKSDLQIIEDIMFNQKLQPGVVNVLIEYVMLRTDMKLNKSYVEKIAGHWSRKQIKTVKEAMDLAKKEHRQYMEWAEEKKSKPKQQKKIIRKEVLPDWFESSQENKDQQKQVDFDFEKEKRLLEEELKEFKSGR